MVGFITKRAMAQDRWTVTIEEDGDDWILPLPEDFLEANDWQPGDTIKWLDNGDGTWQLINMRILNDGGTNLNLTD
jgi:hypothetical protein